MALHRRPSPRRRPGAPAVIRCVIPGTSRRAGPAVPVRADGYFPYVLRPVATLAPPAAPPAPDPVPDPAPGKAARAGLPPRGPQACPPPHGAHAPPHGARDAIATRARALASWLAAVRLRVGDHVFAMNDSEASWRHWQVTKVRGGLGRHYRDPLFDSLRVPGIHR